MKSPPDEAITMIADADSAFFQQRLRYWQPLFTPRNAIIIFMVIGVVFILIGFPILVASNDVRTTSDLCDVTLILSVQPSSQSCPSQIVEVSQAYSEEPACKMTNETDIKQCTVRFDFDSPATVSGSSLTCVTAPRS